MQMKVAEIWESMADTDKEPEDPPLDFGFNYPLSYIVETSSVFLNHGILPNAGGWDDQDAAWTEDFLLFMTGYARARWEYQRNKEAGFNNRAEDLKAPDISQY
jgi:hypothetical protein